MGKIISFDIDGVLADSQPAYYRYTRKPELLFNPDFNIEGILGMSFMEFYQPFCRSGGLLTINLMNQIIPYVLQYLKEEGVTVYFVTDRPEMCFEDTQKWLRLKSINKLGQLHFARKEHYSHKVPMLADLGVDLHVDDCDVIIHNCVQRGVNVVRFDATYNRQEYINHVPSVMSWGNLLLLLTRFLRGTNETGK